MNVHVCTHVLVYRHYFFGVVVILKIHMADIAIQIERSKAFKWMVNIIYELHSIKTVNIYF